MTLTLTPLQNIPLIKTGDDLGQIVLDSMHQMSLDFEDGDIIVLAQKVVSKAEGRVVNLQGIVPSAKAIHIASVVEKDARFVELVLHESREVLRIRKNTLIVVHRRGFVCANAGIDHSNVEADDEASEDWVLLLPENADLSSEKIRNVLQAATGKKLGVMVIDSHGRAWRLGTEGVAIGISGLPGLVDLRGKPDLFGFHLKVTQVGAADELAAAASLVMGQAAEGTPIVHVRGFPYELREGNLSELIRPEELDLFR